MGSSGFWSWVLPGEWAKTDLIKQYTRIVYAVISAIAQEAAKVDFDILRNEKPITSHPFFTLMKKPNPDQSQFQFLEFHFTFMKIFGECYWYMLKGQRSGAPREIYMLRPDLMQVVVDKNDPRGLVKGYIMNKWDGTKIPFDRDEILHFKTPNPANPYYGMGVIEAAKTYIETEHFASEWTRNALYNSGRPSGIVNLKGVIDEDTFKQLKKQFKEEYTGTKNAGKTMLLKGMDGIDYQKLGMELSELALKEMKDMTKEDIMFMFRMSKTMMGISDDVNRANAQENHAVFVENIVKPELDRFFDHLNAFFMPTFGNDTDFLTYVDMDLRSDKEKLEEWSQGHNKWLTTNDIRLERGLDPVPGGDVIYQSIGLVPLTQESEKPTKPQEPNTDNPDDDEDEEPEEDENKGIKKRSKKVVVRNIQVSKDVLSKEDYFKAITIQHQDQWISRYNELVNQEFELQEKEILKRNSKALSKDIGGWMFDLQASKERIVGLFIPMGIELMRQAAKFALDVAGDTDTQFEINARVKEYITDRVDRFGEDMNDETKKQLEATILEGMTNGENLAKLRSRVKEVFTQATETRSTRIARTESLAASNEGANEAYRQSPLVNGKEWSANYGACPVCNSLNGKVIELDATFAKNGQTLKATDGSELKLTYEDISHPPLHPNCRCALLPVIVKQ